MDEVGRKWQWAIGHRGCVVLVLAAVALTPTMAAGDPFGAGDGTIYRLTPESSIEEGCFPPCMCPVMITDDVRGVFVLRYAGQVDGIETYAVDDVSWTALRQGEVVRIIGSGTYSIGSPDPITVVQHRMELDLQLGDDPVQHFDSGWVPIGSWTRVDIAVSLNGMYCWDTAIFIDALPVPRGEIQPYVLAEGSTFQRGCFDPCDCILEPERPLVGTFDLVLLELSLPLTEFAVIDADWEAVGEPDAEDIQIDGFGVYQLLGDFVAQHRLALDLVVDWEPRTHYDSGVVMGGPFPTIDAVVSIHGIECYDTVLHVIADPVDGIFTDGFEDGDLAGWQVVSRCQAKQS